MPPATNLNLIAAHQLDWLTRVGWLGTTVLEDLALLASEVGEAVNECRGAEPTGHLGAELADVVLRAVGIAGKNGIDLDAEIAGKIRLNEKRGTRGRLK